MTADAPGFYDSLYAAWNATKQDDLAWVTEWAQSVRARHAAEFGCGFGRVARQLCEHCASVVAVDRDPCMIRLATRQAAVGGVLRRAKWIVADFNHPLNMLATGSFDLAVCTHNTLNEATGELNIFFDTVRRVLRPNGVLLAKLLIAENYSHCDVVETSAWISRRGSLGIDVAAVSTPAAGPPNFRELHVRYRVLGRRGSRRVFLRRMVRRMWVKSTFVSTAARSGLVLIEHSEVTGRFVFRAL